MDLRSSHSQDFLVCSSAESWPCHYNTGPDSLALRYDQEIVTVTCYHWYFVTPQITSLTHIIVGSQVTNGQVTVFLDQSLSLCAALAYYLLSLLLCST